MENFKNLLTEFKTRWFNLPVNETDRNLYEKDWQNLLEQFILVVKDNSSELLQLSKTVHSLKLD